MDESEAPPSKTTPNNNSNKEENKSNAIQNILQSVTHYAGVATNIPKGEDYEFNRAFRGFPKAMKRHSDACFQAMDGVKSAHFGSRRKQSAAANKSFSELPPGKLHHDVMETIDSLLENVDSLIDDVRGYRLRGDQQLSVSFGQKTIGPAGGSIPSTVAGASAAVSSGGLVTGKPQKFFERPPNNSREEPFRPLLFSEKGELSYGTPGVHPYQSQIEAFSVPSKQLEVRDEKPFKDVAATQLHFIDTEEALISAVAKLSHSEEVAVDLEHHNFHSFQGFTCLVQLSTREEDFIVDCLALRSKMYLLLPIFLNPNIVKVFHSANEDIKWLQKDFGIYVSNMFDTAIALRTLLMPHSLAFLVDHFCQIQLDKRFQTADWRIRPLSMEMLHYARQDTHYLLYCYDRLRFLLLNSESRVNMGNLLQHTWHESKQLCLTQYKKDPFDPTSSFQDAFHRCIGGLNPMQVDLLREVYNWRDAVARTEDESPPAIMHNASILQIASTVPRTPSELLRAAHPVSIIVRRKLQELLELVTRTSGATGGTRVSDRGEVGSKEREEGSPMDAQRAQQGGSASLSIQHQIYRPLQGLLPSLCGIAAAADDETLMRGENVNTSSLSLSLSTSFAKDKKLISVTSTPPSPFFSTVQDAVLPAAFQLSAPLFFQPSTAAQTSKQQLRGGGILMDDKKGEGTVPQEDLPETLTFPNDRETAAASEREKEEEEDEIRKDNSAQRILDNEGKGSTLPFVSGGKGGTAIGSSNKTKRQRDLKTEEEEEEPAESKKKRGEGNVCASLVETFGTGRANRRKAKKR